MGEQQYYEDDYDYQQTAELLPKRNWAQHPAVLVVLLLAIVGLGYLAYRSGSDDDDVAAEDSAAVASEQVAGAEGGAATDTAADEAAAAAGDQEAEMATDDEEVAAPAATSGPSAPIEPPAEGAYVSATLNIDAEPGNGMFVLTGRVPDAETAEAVTRAAEISYAPFVQNELAIDDTLEPAPWLAAAPNVIGLLPSVTDGTIMVADQTIYLSARSPNEEYLAALQGGLALLGGGLPLEMTDVNVTDLEPPLFTTSFEDGTATLSGYVPSEAIIQLLVGGAMAAYGEENVVNELTVDDGTYASFWMSTMPVTYQLFRIFPAYEFTVQSGQFSGSVQGGVNFDTNSTEINEISAQALDIGVSVLARDVTSAAVIIGHTDSDGSEEYNQTLSLARAQSVVDYMVAGGVSPDRLLARGAGELEPIASNDTEEGKARNRRVEFQFGPAAVLLAQG